MASAEAASNDRRSQTGEFEPGASVGRFEVVRLLGRGSMGAVYLARDPLIDRRVAVKTLTGDFSVSPAELHLLRRRFLNEARSAGAMHHPGIVTIYDVIESEDGRLSIAMEYVEGQSLREVLNGAEPLPLEWIGRTISAIAEILDSAHSRGIVHRDIKPANILLATDGRLKIADFGIASLRGDDLASELNALGTPNYLAPERILGRPADHRADVYALGVILFEMLTRRLPFQGETISELARNIVEQPYADPLSLRPDLSAPIVEIVERLLEKEPDTRYQSAGEMAEALARVLEKQAKLSDTVPSPKVEELELVTPAFDSEEPKPPKAAPVETDVESVAGSAPPEESSSATDGPPPEPSPPGPGRLARLLSWRSRTSWRTAVFTALGIGVIAALAVSIAALGGNPEPDPQVLEEARRTAEYEALLDESELHLERGDFRQAIRVLDRAGDVRPGGEEVSGLRAEIDRRWEARLAAERRAEAQALFEEAQEAFNQRDYDSVELTLAALFAVDEDHEGGATLSSAVTAIRSAMAQPAPRPRLPEPVVEEPPVEVVENEPPPVFEAFESVPIVARVDPFGTMRVEFLSQRPKGVVTVYADDQQILRRPFRFFEKRGLVRRRGVSGGFDAEHRLAAGDLNLRVYVALPGRETQIMTVSGSLAAGTEQTLEIRVDGSGRLTAGLR